MPRSFAKVTFDLMLMLFCFTVSPALADDSGDELQAWQSNWQCGSKVTLPKDMIALLDVDHVSPARGKLPAFILGVVRGNDSKRVIDRPIVLFVQQGNSWQAYSIASSESVYSVFSSPDTGRVMIFTMFDMEAPGQSYTVVSTDNGFATLTCGELPKPDAKLDTTDFMQIKTFEGDAAGVAVVKGMISFGDPARADAWFQARTTDGGRTWSVPKEITPPVFLEVPTANGVYDDLVDGMRNALR